MSALQEIALDIAADQASKGARPAAAEADRTDVPSATSGFGRGGRLFNWFSSLPIGQKIRVFYFGNLSFALLAGVFIILAQFSLAERAEKTAIEHSYAFDAQALATTLSEAQRHTEAWVTSRAPARATAAQDKLHQAHTLITTLQAKVQSSSTDAGDKLRLIDGGVVDLQSQISAATQSRLEGARADAQAREIRATGSLALESSRQLAEQMRTDAKTMSDAGAAFIALITLVWIASAAILVVLTLIAMRYFDRNVGGTLKAMTAEMKKLASGQSKVTISGQDRRDEIGDMARAMEVFHHAAKRLERLSRERAEKARAELDEQTRMQEQREEGRRERERMLSDVADQFERNIGDVLSGVAEAAAQLQTTSQMMANTADQSSTRVADVSTSMQEAKTGATAAAAASDEFAMSIGEISRQAASSAELARQATETATSADTTISALSDSAQQVGQIVELIQTIAQRTNLLALNASIEAARGGEAGRGFAVVASEVKELAMQTSRATEQVAEQIRAMQDTTGDSVSALRSIAEQVQQLETTAVSIASAVDQQSVAGQDLARSIDLAARGSEQVSDHIDDVRELSLLTGSAASQVLSSASNLEQQASTLRGQANAFLAKVRVS
ncbi:MAG: methyl-accepting chemotaxis protein [Pseudomonadota bacterium]